MFGIFWVFLFVHSTLSFPRGNKAISCGYETCPKTDPNKLNVHYVAHTHDDVGWIKTFDQYYYGSKSNIRKAGVQYILDSVVDVLLKDPNKKFIYVETSFFWKWWVEQTQEMQQSVKDLVDEGRLEFIGGAWVMNDEATTIYQTTIDQFTWGLRRLNDTFGTCGQPKIGWQIDPFGHAREQASLMAQYGFDGLFFGRLDYQDKEKRVANNTMEMVWETSDTLGASTDLFTGALYNHYTAPISYCFDPIWCPDEPMIDDINSPGYNLDYRTFGFYIYIQGQKKHYRTNNIMLTMGGDFQYQQAHVYFKNSDKLIKYTNEFYPDLNIFYSTPSCYLKSLHEANMSWPVKSDDFFPYASGSNSYWTGYFTSRPTLKLFERVANNVLQVGKQLACTAGIAEQSDSRLTKHREAQGVLQHHDAITGTEKQAVAEDYARLLQIGVAATEEVISDALNILLPKSSSSSSSSNLTFDSCNLRNISQCATAETSTSFLVTVYNPLSRNVNKYIRLPVSNGTYTVTDPSGGNVAVQMIPIAEPVKNIPGRTSTAEQEMLFVATDVPPFGYKSYYVTKASSEHANHYLRTVNKGIDTIIRQGNVTIIFDAKTNYLKQVKSGRETYDMSQTLEYYIGAAGTSSGESTRASGAYIFRPASNESAPIAPTANITVVDGPIASEVRQVFSQWASQIVRQFSDSNIIEFEWLVGPIPIEDSNGREVVSKFRTNLNTEGKITTDSNGRSDLARQRDYRPTWNVDLKETVSGNYYPITTNLYIDNGTDRLALITDRAQGAGSMKDGQVEVMVHRRLLRDDAFGVEESLNETAFGTGLVARGQHLVLIGPTNSTASTRAVHLKAQEKLMDSLDFVTDVTGKTFEEIKTAYNLQFSGLINPLPEAVQILTLEPWKVGTFLLRLENVFTSDESATTETIDLTKLFTKFNVITGQETNLAGNKFIDETTRLQWKKETSDQATPPSRSTRDVDITKIELKPKEIRTFIISTILRK